MSLVNGFVNRRCRSGRVGCVIVAVWLDHDRSQQAACDQFGESLRDLAAGLQVGLDVLLLGERDVCVAEPDAERLPVDLGVPARCGVAVADVVQVDQGEPAARTAP